MEEKEILKRRASDGSAVRCYRKARGAGAGVMRLSA